jgi:ATP-dependent RNA helicase DHX29
MIIIRSLLLNNSQLKVVLMSATADAERFSSYFDRAPVLTIPGRTFPVEVKYLEDAVELTRHSWDGRDREDEPNSSEADADDNVTSNQSILATLHDYSAGTRNYILNLNEYQIDYGLIMKLILKISLTVEYQKFSTAFLVFLPGIAEIRKLQNLILDNPLFADAGWLIHPLHSSIDINEQQAAFQLPPQNVRKIVLATNIAETGVTIPDITCVIDCGSHKEMRFDERRQVSRLVQSFISRANAKQRRGRAGRVQEGLCFHLFTKHRYDTKLAPQQTPEMLRLSLQDLIMRTKICNLGDIEETLSGALDPPSPKNIRRSIDAMIELGALTSNEELTSLGRQLAKLPLDARLGKLVLLSTVFGCVDMAVTVAAILSSKSPFSAPFGMRQRADAARISFAKGDSDLLTEYNAYQGWKSVCLNPSASETEFCRKNMLSTRNLLNIEDLKIQLLTSLVDAGFMALSSSERTAWNRYGFVRKCIQ